MSKNNAIDRYDNILDELMNLAINRFEWDNLPLGLTSEQLERMLITNGQLLAFEDENIGLMILPCHSECKINVYGLPTSYRVNSLNGKYSKTIDVDKGVLLRNNPIGSNDIDNLNIYARRIADIECTQEVNLFQQNIPKIVLTDEDGKLTVKNLIKKLQEFKFVIIGRKSLKNNLNKSDVLDTTSPFLLNDLQDYKNSLYNEILTKLGINNNNIDKKERLLVDEVNANDELISIMLDLMEDMRLKFVEEFNSKFNKNISCKRREVNNDRKEYNDPRGIDRE